MTRNACTHMPSRWKRGVMQRAYFCSRQPPSAATEAPSTPMWIGLPCRSLEVSGASAASLAMCRKELASTEGGSVGASVGAGGKIGAGGKVDMAALSSKEVAIARSPRLILIAKLLGIADT